MIETHDEPTLDLAKPLLLCAACAGARALPSDERFRRCATDVEIEGACEDCSLAPLPLEVWVGTAAKK